MNKTLLKALLAAMVVLFSAESHSQTTALDVDKLIKALPKECEEASSVLAEARLRKWEKRAKEISQPITGEQRAAVYGVMRDQCVAVQMVLILRNLRSSISIVDWSKMNGDAQIEELLARIERTL